MKTNMDAIVLFENATRFFFKEEKIDSFSDKLLLNKSRMKNYKGFLVYSTIEGIGLMVITMIALAQFFPITQKLELFFAICIFSFFCPYFVNFLFQDIMFEKRKREKEDLLSDLLLETSVFTDESSAIQTIKRISELDFPLLKEDFLRAYTELQNGASVEEVIARMQKLNKSKAITRATDLFLHGYKSGARISSLLKETAEDLLEAKAILKERQAVMLVTKYTLILAAGVIVPAILGLIIGLVSGMSFDAMGELSLGLSTQERKEIFNYAIIGTTIYVFEYALLSSFFLSLQEGNKKNFWVYSLALAPIAGVIFFIAKTLK